MSDSPRRRVLYMEDDVAQARLVQKLLQRADYDVDVVPDGETGLERYAAADYDAVIVDQTMPGLSGLETIRGIAARGPLPPTIMVTGTGNEQIAVEVMKLGVSDYLVKDTEGGFINVLPVALHRAIQLHLLEIENQRAERQLALFRSFAEASVQGFGMADFNFRVHYVNPALCKMLGGTEPARLVGEDFRRYFSQDSLSRLEQKVLPAVFGSGQWSGETTLFPADGSPIPVLYSVFLIRDEQDTPLFFGGTVTDIREQLRMEQDLAQAHKMEAIGQLAAGIAHEINTPMQYVGDNLRFLQDASHDAAALLVLYRRLLDAARRGDIDRALLDKIDARRQQMDLDYLAAETPKAIRQSLEGVEHVASIVGAMKEFSHPGSRQKKAVDLNRAIRSTLTISRHEWKYVADVVTDFDPDLPPILCLPSDINQAVLNLVINAAQAIGEATHGGADGKGTITVRTRRHGDGVEIAVEDTGPGIPPEIRTRVFDPFFTTKEVGRGTGQGLAIARSIVVDRHGGTIQFESQEGRGTTFVIRLPIAAGAATPVPGGSIAETLAVAT